MGIGGLIAGGTALAGALMGGHETASNVQLPPQFQMPGMGTAANQALSGIGNLPGANLGATTVPLAQQTGMNLYNNPYAGQYQQGAGAASGLGIQQALNQYGQGGALGGAGMNLLGNAGQLSQLGFDPQSALYNRTLGQVQDQTGAQLANSGILNSPYGQGVMGNTLGNFNIDWQNNMLQRALAGSQGANLATGAGGQAIGQGAGLQAGAPGQLLTSAALPYSTYSGIGQGQLGALTGLQGVAGGAQGLAQQPIADYLQYLGVGNQAGQVANQGAQNALQQNQMAWNQNQQLGQGMGQGLYGIGAGLFGRGGGSGFGGGGGGLFGSLGGLFG